jgi:O-antigen/teichoic acid export membrane protein
MDYLEKIEKKLKIDIRYIFKPAMGLSLNQILKVALTFLLSIAFANLLDPETYGQYRYIVSVIGFLSIFTLSGMGTAITRAVARGFDGSLDTAIKTEIRWGAIGGLFAFVLAGYYLFQKRVDLAAPLFVSAIFLPFYNVFSLYSAVLQGKKLFRLIIKYDFINQLVYVVLLIAMLLATDNIFLLILPYLFLGTVFQWICYWSTKKKVKLNNNTEDDVIGYGLSLSILKGLDIAKSSLHSIFIFVILGASDLSFFYFAIAPIEQARTFLRLGETILLPKMSSDKWLLSSGKVFIKKMIPFLGVVSLGVIFYIFVSTILFQAFFPKYTGAIFYSQLYSPTLLLTALLVVLTSVLKAKKQLSAIYFLNLSEIVITVLVTIPLIYFYGVVGLIASIYFLKLFQVLYTFKKLFYTKSLGEKVT